MSKPSLIHYTTVTRDIDAPIGEVWGLVAGFSAEKACQYPLKEYTFPEELTAYDASKHSMTLQVRRPDYPDMIAFGTTVLDQLGPNKSQFRWIAEGSLLPDEYTAILREDLNKRFDGLIVAIANQLV
ncbi:hypothetical protein N8T08_005626 [Aspergillus melleus]|uniref:Uncharacterized protein n=1 Tax=Aspergillus melleus TaxID=138277 RepID=A0ACC3B1R0_9EURO|nr:hypothetical protein N8T08_005626 [Aspergillus melleus]